MISRRAASRLLGTVKDWSNLDTLIQKDTVRCYLICPQSEPHLVVQWAKTAGYCLVQQLTYLGDGISPPNWAPESQRVTVDHTFALNSAFEEIKVGLWWIPRQARYDDIRPSSADYDWFYRMTRY